LRGITPSPDIRIGDTSLPSGARPEASIASCERRLRAGAKPAGRTNFVVDPAGAR
jgi:hypothetical protein